MMKKIFLLTWVLLAALGCSQDDAVPVEQAAEKTAAFVPHFYGMAMPEKVAPSTKGVANLSKVWNKQMSKNLTVQFLNGTSGYKELVKTYVQEWEKAADVKFIFVEDDQDALIRIGFDYVPGMMSSWALTGTDHLQAFGNQSEPTVHFAQWRRSSDEQKCSDVLRAFGQVLGLELEFRHPDFEPGWITDPDGNINEAKIREYWEGELADYITWAELKKVVLDPLQLPSFLLSKTDEYDPESVMTWPFYDMIANNIPMIEYDTDYKTQLSEQDKKFVENLYGESSLKPKPLVYLPLIEMECTGSKVGFSLTTTQDLTIIWDIDDKEAFQLIDASADSTGYFSLSHTYTENKVHKIIVGQTLKEGQLIPKKSVALIKFDLHNGNKTRNIDIKNINEALEYIRVWGGYDFEPCHFFFDNFKSLKEVYLVRTLNSSLAIGNCPNLESIGTGNYIYKPWSVTHPKQIPEPYQAPDFTWPQNAEPIHSLELLWIRNCPNIKSICLEHTRITSFNFTNLPNLDYVFLSSTPQYIVGGPNGGVNGENTIDAIRFLPDRTGKTNGWIVMKNIGTEYMMGYLKYSWVQINDATRTTIEKSLAAKNWRVVWEELY